MPTCNSKEGCTGKAIGTLTILEDDPPVPEWAKVTHFCSDHWWSFIEHTYLRRTGQHFCDLEECDRPAARKAVVP